MSEFQPENNNAKSDEVERKYREWLKLAAIKTENLTAFQSARKAELEDDRELLSYAGSMIKYVMYFFGK